MWSVSNLKNVQFSSDVPSQQSFSFPGNPVLPSSLQLQSFFLVLVSLFNIHTFTFTTISQFLILILKVVDNNYIKRQLLKQRNTFPHWNVDNSAPKNATEISKLAKNNNKKILYMDKKPVKIISLQFFHSMTWQTSEEWLTLLVCCCYLSIYEHIWHNYTDYYILIYILLLYITCILKKNVREQKLSHHSNMTMRTHRKLHHARVFF